jgi:RHS repeat-associated protein
MSRRTLITEKSNGLTTEDSRYIWDGSEIVERRAANGTIWEQRYYPEGFVDATEGDFYYTRDHLGSIREVIADDGLTVESQYDYGVWGEVERIAGTGIESVFRYTGHYYHVPSELHLTWFRAYDAEFGRWLSRDPIGIAGGINLYGYVLNNPVLFWDPLGLILEFRIGPPGEDRDYRDLRGPNYQPGPEDFSSRPLRDSLIQTGLKAQDAAQNCAADFVGGIGDGANALNDNYGDILSVAGEASWIYLETGSALYVAARNPLVGSASVWGALAVKAADIYSSSGDFFQGLEDAIRPRNSSCP